MGFRLLITAIAHRNIQDTYDYYVDKVSIDIADKFFNDLQEIYQALSINPFYQIHTKQYRAIPLKRFPYLLFFEIEEQKQLVKFWHYSILLEILPNGHNHSANSQYNCNYIRVA